MGSKIFLCSDMHHEIFGKDEAIDVPAEADIAIIAGDLEYMPKALEITGKTADKSGLPVIFVPGNHEYYHRDYEAMNELANIYEHENVHILINRSVTLNGIRFIGTPLWSNFLAFGEGLQEVSMEVAERYINDFRVIKSNGKPITAEMMLGWHLEARHFLETELSKPFNGKTVIVTHFPPSYQLCHDRFMGEPLSPYFNAECDDIIKKYQHAAWCYGHTHSAVEKIIHGVPMFSNMGGYPNESQEITGFDPNKLIIL
jgi:Icc-related predicted phosphoesterase